MVRLAYVKRAMLITASLLCKNLHRGFFNCSIKGTVFWRVKPLTQLNLESFIGTHCLHLQGPVLSTNMVIFINTAMWTSTVTWLRNFIWDVIFQDINETSVMKNHWFGIIFTFIPINYRNNFDITRYFYSWTVGQNFESRQSQNSSDVRTTPRRCLWLSKWRKERNK